MKTETESGLRNVVLLNKRQDKYIYIYIIYGYIWNYIWKSNYVTERARGNRKDKERNSWKL
jgi:hypothetical protein